MKPRYTKADKRPTWTHKVVEALKTLDDFATMEQLRLMTGADRNQIQATLHWLKRADVVDAMDNDGRLWWYLTGEDRRSRSVDERAEEPKGNRSRKKQTPKE